MEKIKTLKNEASAEFTEKKSVFIGYAAPVSSEDGAREFVAKIKKKHADARHNVSAYILSGGVMHSSDDGEPSGTAGVPVLEVIKKSDIMNAVVVVTRYFGGILLGASGLANAYKTAARDAIEHAEIIEKTINIRYRLQFEYALMNDVMRVIKEYGLTPLNQDFNLDCRLEIEVRQSQSVRLYDTIAKLRGVKIETV